MRTNVLAILTIFVLTTAPTLAVAAPPMTGKPKSGQWLDTINPTKWDWPSMPWSQEPPRIQKKSEGVVSNLNQSAKKSWSKTKSVLNPSRLFINDDKPKPAKQKDSSTGFFSGLFAPKEEPKEVNTVNDFLSLPHPR